MNPIIRFSLISAIFLGLAGCETFSPGRIDRTEGSPDGPKRTETGYYQGF